MSKTAKVIRDFIAEGEGFPSRVGETVELVAKLENGHMIAISTPQGVSFNNVTKDVWLVKAKSSRMFNPVTQEQVDVTFMAIVPDQGGDVRGNDIFSLEELEILE